MSSIEEDRGDALTAGETPDSWKEFADKLYSKDHLGYHTEVIHPDALTFLDMTAEHFGKRISPVVGKFIKADNQQYRENMVAYQRKRAGETERIAKGKQEEEKEAKKLKEVMLGLGR